MGPIARMTVSGVPFLLTAKEITNERMRETRVVDEAADTSKLFFSLNNKPVLQPMASWSNVDRTGAYVCQICCECYNTERQSRVLPCGHTFCLSCLQDLLHTSPSALVCPNCRAVVALDPAALAALPRVYALEGPPEQGSTENRSIAAVKVATDHAGGQACENDGCLREASLFCKNCNSALCEGCDGDIHCNAFLKKHARVDLAQRPILCSDHHEAVHMFCEEDKVLVCFECLKPGARHGGHPTTHVDTVAAKERDQMKKQLASLGRDKVRIAADIAAIEKERKALANSCGTRREEINSLKDFLDRQVNRVIGRLFEDLADVLKERDAQLEQDLDATRTLHEVIDQGLGLAERAQQSSSAGLVQQRVGRRLEEVAVRTRTGGWSGLGLGLGLVELDLQEVQGAADALASLAARKSTFARPAKVRVTGSSVASDVGGGLIAWHYED